MSRPATVGVGALDDPVDAEVRHRFLATQGRSGQDPVSRLEELFVQVAPLMAPDEAQRRARSLAGDLVGLGPLQRLLEDPLVSDVLVNGPGVVWVERAGRLERSDVVLDADALSRSIERVVGPLGLRADRSCPVVDARLPDGTRVAAVLPPLAVDGPLLAVRRHAARPFTLDAFADGPTAEALRRAVRSRRNLVVHGPTGSGKTTLLNALGAELPADERVVTIEDVAELRFPGVHVVRLEARPGTADGIGRVGIRELVRAALRLRPDRIVVGEVRGSEALDMVWALSTGHRGGFSTCHADGPRDALRRLETFCLTAGLALPLDAVRSQVRSAVDVLVGVDRRDDGSRHVVSVHEVTEDGLGPCLVAGRGDRGPGHRDEASRSAGPRGQR